MKKHTKWLAFILCCALLFNGCSSTKDDDKDNDKPDQTVESPTDTPQEEPTKAPDDVIVLPEITPEPTEVPTEPTPTEAPIAERSLPIISIRPHQKTWYTDDQTTCLLTVDDFTLYISNDGFDALQNSFNELHTGVVDTNYDELLLWATEHYTSDSSSFWGYYSSCSAEWSRCDSNIVSMQITYSDYTGGAHGMYSCSGETYDVKTGQLLYLSDIIQDVEGFYPLAVDYLIDALYTEYEDGLFPDYQTQVSDTIIPENEPKWYLSASGIVICFSPYEVGPYAMGAPEITLPYELFEEYMREEYRMPQGEFVAHIAANQDFSRIIGASEPVYIEMTMDGWEMENIIIHSGSTTIDMGQFAYSTPNYITRHANGRCFLIFSGDRMSGDYETHIFEITSGAIEECATLYNTQPGTNMITPTNWEMQVRMDLLGTYTGSVMYNLSSTGEFTRAADIYYIDTQNALEIIKPLPVILDDKDTSLPVGEKIYVTGTNNVDEIYFRVDGTNQYGTIRFTREPEEWYSAILINGVSESEYFKSLPYAG